MVRKVIEVSVSDHRLKVREGSKVLKDYPIATGKYSGTKYWGWDYRTSEGTYLINDIFREGSDELVKMNSKEYKWYQTNMARDPHEGAGAGVYGAGVIGLTYPNRVDIDRFKQLGIGGLREVWEKFCEEHWRPIYERVAKDRGTLFESTSVDGDYGDRTYRGLLKDFPVSDIRVAFGAATAIHGTNDPDCIGTNISGGCIRMHDKDITELIEEHVRMHMRVVIKP